MRTPAARCGQRDISLVRESASHFLDLTGAPVKTRHFTSSGAVYDVGVERIGRDVSVFDHSDRMPVAKRDLAVIAATRNTDRAALLLSGANLVGERIGRR